MPRDGLTEKIYHAAVSTWGKESQYEMLVEECAELIVAIKKLRRDSTHASREKHLQAWVNFIGEIADVKIMIEQIILADNLSNLVKHSRECKIKRLKERLEKCGATFNP